MPLSNDRQERVRGRLDTAGGIRRVMGGGCQRAYIAELGV